jgi:hypothetical protein
MTDRVLHMRMLSISYTSTPMLYSLQIEVYYHDRYPDGLVPRLSSIRPSSSPRRGSDHYRVGVPIHRRRRDIATVLFHLGPIILPKRLSFPPLPEPAAPPMRQAGADEHDDAACGGMGEPGSGPIP